MNYSDESGAAAADDKCIVCLGGGRSLSFEQFNVLCAGEEQPTTCARLYIRLSEASVDLVARISTGRLTVAMRAPKSPQ